MTDRNCMTPERIRRESLTVRPPVGIVEVLSMMAVGLVYGGILWACVLGGA